jgi:glycosyltransferase involved in cell wall biosynthesis
MDLGTPSLVSVIIPCYKQAQYLPEAIDSALAQTYPHVEIIVVNDGSPDDTAEVAARYGTRIRYIEQENRGLPAARNAGILASTGQFLQFLDSDDHILPAKLSDQVAAFTAHPEVGVVYSEGYYIDEDGARTGPAPVNHKSGWVFHDLLTLHGTSVPAPLIRRDCLAQVGLFDPKMRSCEDVDLWLRIALRYQFLALPDMHFEYRVWSNSMSKNGPVMVHHIRELLRRYGHAHPRCRECRRARAEGMHRLHLFTAYSMMGHARESMSRGDWRTACSDAWFVVRHDPTHLIRMLDPRHAVGKASLLYRSLTARRRRS